MLLAGCLLAVGPPDDVLRPELLAEAFGSRLVRGDGSTVVIDEHGHAHDDCPDGEPEAADAAAPAPPRPPRPRRTARRG